MIINIFFLVSVISSGFFADGKLNEKIEICHIISRQGDFKTISISENAWKTHEKHGDLRGTCVDNLDVLCDDGDPCTIDFDVDSGCLDVKPQISCDDGNPLTQTWCEEECVFSCDANFADQLDNGDCVCVSGYELVNGICVDINECETVGICDEVCFNFGGGFMCELPDYLIKI